MNRVITATALTILISVVALASQRSAPPVVEVYKSATCGCCSKWVDHMRTSGFDVRTNNVEDIDAVKKAYRVPDSVASCHTAVVNGYVVEGHVPAWEIRRMLTEKPAVVGIAVPGMPVGSPGMEVAGIKAQPFAVVSFDKQGKTVVVGKY